jgi:hypothetical protein
MHALIVARGTREGTPDGHQVIPFLMYREQLSRRLGLTFDLVEAREIAELERLVAERDHDVAFLLTDWAVTPEEVVSAFRRIRERGPKGPLIFVDYYASTGSSRYGVLPYVDLYVKRQVLRDRGAMLVDHKGGSVLTEYLADTMGFDLGGWYAGSPPDPGQMSKIVAGWNLGITPRYRKALRLSGLLPIPWGLRPIDVNRRIGLSQSTERREWYQDYRLTGLETLDALEGRHRLSGSGRISPKAFLAEMALSKICFSPFGWGEVCFRDYEAVSVGALLLKPRMDHLETSPDIYVPFETYVPVEWDYRDMVDRIEHLLSHPDEAARIARNARRRLRDYYETDAFVDEIGRILGRLAAPEVEPIAR